MCFRLFCSHNAISGYRIADLDCGGVCRRIVKRGSQFLGRHHHHCCLASVYRSYATGERKFRYAVAEEYVRNA